MAGPGWLQPGARGPASHHDTVNYSIVMRSVYHSLGCAYWAGYVEYPSHTGTTRIASELS